MKIVFVDNLLLEQKNGTYKFDLQPHLGLTSLIAVLEACGHEASLYDPKLAVANGDLALDASLYSRLAAAVLDERPDVVGFTTLGCNFICTTKIASHLKRNAPEIAVLLGGPHASILGTEILSRFPQFDAVVRNEAEPTIAAIVEAATGGDYAGIPGVTFRSGRRIVENTAAPLIADLDSLPRPAFHRYPIRKLGLTSLRVEAGRGCPFNCTFCSTASFFGRRYRLKSASRLCAELDDLNERYGISHFSLTHDLFTVNKAKVAEFCDAVAGRGYTWTCSARMDCVDEQLLDRMAAAGCTSIYYGVETGSPRMQEITQKHLDLSLFFPTLDVTHRVGMAATASFITGYPEEDESDQDATLDLIGSCFDREGLTVQLHLLTPEPGTALLERYRDDLEYDGHISDFNFPTLESDDGSIMRANPDLFVNHHYYRAALPRHRHVLTTSVYHTLYKLGFPVLRHLVSYYESRLSLLLGAMVDWAASASDPGPYDEAFLCRFMSAAWGPDHYLASLVRYMLSASTLRTDPCAPPHAGAERPGAATCVLSCSATVLRDIHECPPILAMITAQKTSQACVPARLVSKRGSFLLLLDVDDPKSVRNFEIDEAVAALLERCREPCLLSDGLAELEDQFADVSAGAAIEELLRLGALRLDEIARPAAFCSNGRDAA